jgi:hypothetical protein
MSVYLCGPVSFERETFNWFIKNSKSDARRPSYLLENEPNFVMLSGRFHTDMPVLLIQLQYQDEQIQMIEKVRLFQQKE